MIEKIYTCDLCGSKCKNAGEPNEIGWRLRWDGLKIKLVNLYGEASEKIICGKCIADLKEEFKGG